MPSDVMFALKYSTRDLGDTGPDNDYGWGLPDAYIALNYEESGIDETPTKRNQDFILLQPYPNPFNQNVTITFSVHSESYVTLEIFDITGRRVSKLFDNMFIPGKYQAIWNGENYASGVYFIKAKAGEMLNIKRAILVK